MFSFRISEEVDDGLDTYSGVVFAQGLLADGQGIVEQVGGLLVFVLVPVARGGRAERLTGRLKEVLRRTTKGGGVQEHRLG